MNPQFTPHCERNRFWSASVSVAIALALLWSVGLFERGYWTPDEPREAALAASMSMHPTPLPSLAGVSFAEKPPLTYWLAGAALRLFGAMPAAARAPQLLYALLGFLAVVVLARRLLGAGHAAGDARMPCAGAVAAGLLFACSELVYQVQIWLDTDALLLAGVCMALAGMYAGLTAPAAGPAAGAAARNSRLVGYGVMHVGLTLAFFAKNFAAWLVPVLAFLTFMIWERRWRELRRWELYAGVLLPAVCIGLWIRAVAAQPDGAHALRVLFWNNLAGRAMPVAAEAQFNYATGHPNRPGKYFIELWVDLLPWTGIALAALIAAGRRAVAAGPRRIAWRFALCCAFPGLVVLSFAATARGIYAAPCMIGFALLMALWAADASGPGAAGGAISLTAALIAALAALVLAATVALQWTVLRGSWPLFLLSALSAAAVIAWSLNSCRATVRRAQPAPVALIRLALGWALLLSLGVLSLCSAMNRSQDVQSLATRLARAAGPRPILLWNGDETTLALAQLYWPAGSWSALDGSLSGERARLAAQLRAVPETVVVSMIKAPPWPRSAWLAYLRGAASLPAVASGLPAGAVDPSLAAAGLERVNRVDRPGGRGYWLWARPRAILRR